MQQAASKEQTVGKRSASDLLAISGAVAIAVALVAGYGAYQFEIPLAGLAALGFVAAAWLCLAAVLAIGKRSGSAKLWGGLRWLPAASWVVLLATVTVAVLTSLDSPDLPSLMLVVGVGIWAWSLLTWGAYLAPVLWWLSLLISGAAVALFWMAGLGVWAIAVGVIELAISVVGWWVIYRRIKIRSKLVWLSSGLGPATNDDRPAPMVFSPSWGRAHGLPMEWNYPPSLTPDPKRRDELDRVISERLDTPARVEWKAVTATIQAVAPKAPRGAFTESIESVLASMLPGAVVTNVRRESDGSDALSEVVFTWPPQSSVRASSPAYQNRISKSLQAAIGLPLSVNFDTPAFTGRAEPLTPLPDVIPHPPRDPNEPMKIRFGQFRGGKECVWDLDAPLPHLLINGGTGGGKTVLLLSLLTSLPLGSVDIRAIDPKMVGLYNLGLIPGAKDAATSEVEMVDTLFEVKHIMDERYQHLKKNGPSLRKTLTPLVLVIDEGEEMHDLLNDWWKSGEGKSDWQERFNLAKPPTGTAHPVMSVLGSILRLGREARVHVILSSQQASAAWLSTSSRSQFAVRIALRNLEATSSIMLFGSPIATSGLENKSGRAWVSLGQGERPEHAQIYWTPKFDVGLNDSDRAILHGLGITLPDDEGYRPQVDAPATDELELPDFGTAPAALIEAPVLDAAPELDEEPESLDAEIWDATDVPVLSIEDGMRILIEVDGGTVPATVEGLEPDEQEPDYLALTYRTDDGELGVLSLSDDESVQAISIDGLVSAE